MGYVMPWCLAPTFCYHGYQEKVGIEGGHEGAVAVWKLSWMGCLEGGWEQSAVFGLGPDKAQGRNPTWRIPFPFADALLALKFFFGKKQSTQWGLLPVLTSIIMLNGCTQKLENWKRAKMNHLGTIWGGKSCC